MTLVTAREKELERAQLSYFCALVSKVIAMCALLEKLWCRIFFWTIPTQTISHHQLLHKIVRLAASFSLRGSHVKGEKYSKRKFETQIVSPPKENQVSSRKGSFRNPKRFVSRALIADRSPLG